MGNYILKRTLLIIPTMFLVSIIVFLFQRFIPGSAVDVIEAQFIAMGQTDIDRAAIIHQLGLDVPILQQYINWIGGIITRGDFGTSMLQNKPVLDLIASRVGPTLELGFMTVPPLVRPAHFHPQLLACNHGDDLSCALVGLVAVHGADLIYAGSMGKFCPVCHSGCH